MIRHVVLIALSLLLVLAAACTRSPPPAQLDKDLQPQATIFVQSMASPGAGTFHCAPAEIEGVVACSCIKGRKDCITMGKVCRKMGGIDAFCIDSVNRCACAFRL